MPRSDLLFDSVFSQSSLEAIAAEHARVKTHRGADGISPLQYQSVASSDLFAARQRINARRYRFTRLKSIYKLKPGGSTSRQIQIPTVRDRIILSALKSYLDDRGLPKGPGLPTSTASQVSKAVVRNDLGLEAFARTDIADFFPSVMHSFLMSMLGALDLDSRAEYLIAKSLELSAEDGKGVPQGISIATSLTEYYINSAISPIVDGLRLNGAIMFRYVDDFLVLAPSRGIAEECMGALGDALLRRGLTVHQFSDSSASKSEVGLVSDGFPFLGYNFDSTGASVPSAKITSILDRVSSIVHTCKRESGESSMKDHAAARANWFMKVAMVGCIWRGRRRGWLPYYLGTNDLDAFGLVTRRARAMVAKSGLQGVVAVPSMVEGYFSYRRGRYNLLLDLDRLPVDERVAFLTDVCLMQKSRVLSYSEDEINAEYELQVGSRLDSLEIDLSLQVY